MASFVSPMLTFNSDDEVGGNQTSRWRTWLADFKIFIAACYIITKKRRQRELLLYQAGPRVREIFRQFPDPGTDDDVAKTEELLMAYFEPQKNRLYEVHKFRQANKELPKQSISSNTRLPSLTKNCEFSDKLVKPFFNIKNEIAMDNKGLVKTKASLPQHTWFPNMDKTSNQKIKACLPCQVKGPLNHPEPLLTTGLPHVPWTSIHPDFYAHFSTNSMSVRPN